MKNTPNLAAIVKILLAGLDDRQKAILEGRFGISDGENVTLAKLGQGYGITRERVRQIEALALDAVKKKSPSAEFQALLGLILKYFENAGGVKRETELLHDLRALLGIKATPAADNQIRFFLEASGKVKFAKDNNLFHAFWYTNEKAKKEAQDFSKDLLTVLKDKREAVLGQNAFPEIFSAVSKQYGLNEGVAMNYAVIGKKFAKNAYGEFGLAQWSEVNPRTARDWAHLVLRKEKRPLHFTAIAKSVNDLRREKPVHHQTIHNELIKDDKFVLVGKGTYGLREFGLTPGTAREVIATLIKKHGPLPAKEVIERVLSERLLKPNTILINLQNKKHFERMGDGRYNIKEA